METINNMATAAAKVVWGDSDANKEPISGAQGDVSKGQPYDAGNLDSSDQKKVESNIESTREPQAVDASNVKDTTATREPQAADNLDTKDNTAAQVDTKDPGDENAEVEPKGPGPRPLEVVAKEHGGDAGKDAPLSSTSATGPDPANKTPNADVIAESESSGSGQQYVKATGLAADGGDFDASRPGAGREADRLMEQKGLHRDEDKAGGHGSGSHGSGHQKDKPSLGERIKAKLHKH